jgi:hypothetical protein
VVHDHYYHGTHGRNAQTVASTVGVTAGGEVDLMSGDERAPFYNPQYGHINGAASEAALTAQLQLSAHSDTAANIYTTTTDDQQSSSSWMSHTDQVMVPKCSGAEYKGSLGSTSSAHECLAAVKAKVRGGGGWSGLRGGGGNGYRAKLGVSVRTRYTDILEGAAA